MRSANPALKESVFKGLDSLAGDPKVMTLQGAVNKTGFLLLVLIATATFTWQFVMAGGAYQPFLVVGVIGGLIFALVTIFKKTWAPVTSVIYAAFEGLVLGGISALAESMYPGIAFQAVALTFGTLGCLLAAYTTRLIKPTENFKLGIVAATGGIAMLYLASFALRLFGIHFPYIHESGLIGIGFSMFVVVIAALNLVLDFDFIETGAAEKAPKYMEWYAAFGLMMTLIWLYIEILHLLMKLQRRD